MKRTGRNFYIIFTSGNILCVWTFNKKDVELKASFANLLKCLSVFDTIFLVSWIQIQSNAESSGFGLNNKDRFL